MVTDDGTTRGLGGTPPIAPVRPARTVPVALLLFPAASVFGYMSQNLNQTTLMDVIPVLSGALAFAVAIWLLVVVLRRRADAGAAVIACLWVTASLYYLGLFGALNTWIGGDYTLVATLPFVVAALLAATFAVHRLRALDAPLHVVLSVIAAVMVATPLWHIVSYEWRNASARAVYDPERAAAEMAQFAGPTSASEGGAARPPDIYHFVFDRYGSAETLADHFGVDASIGDFLQDHGFFVATQSHSNYLKTGHSLASTFYMDYLNLLSDEPRVAGGNWRPVFAMLADHRAARFLRDRGYSFLQFGSWWRGTHENPVADANHPYGFSEFAMYYLRHTVLRTVVVGLLPDSRLAGRLDWDNGQCQRVARQVERIKAIGQQDEPVYVFAHFLLPHDPFVFAPDGACLPLQQANARGTVQGYVDQVAYADRVIEDIVTALQAEGRPQPVILIQADEGPFPDRDYGVAWQDATAEELRIKTGILNAYYFPDGDYSLLAPDITPVNTYRTLFNKYFGTSYPTLPNRIYAFPFDDQLYDFRDITERVRGDLEAAPAGALRSRAAVREPSELRLR